MTRRRWRTVIADDERIARRGLRRLIESDPEVAVTGECSDGREVIAALQGNPPDLLFLDIQMPFLNGLDCLATLGAEHTPVTVIVSAHPQYAVGAFDAQAADYLLKPYRDARLFAALARAKRQLEHRADERPAPPAAYAERLGVRTERGMRIVSVDDIDWIEADDYEARLHVRGQAVRVRDALTSLEQRLDPARFVRVHRSAIVNIARVVEVQPYFHGRHVLLLTTGAKLVLARGRREQFERALGREL